MNKGLRILAVIAALWANKAVLSADSPAPTEYEVKGALLYNLTKYVDWPARSFSSSNSPMVVAILGLDNFGDDFKRMVDGKTINGRKLVLKRMSWSDDLRSVHLLFVSASEKKRLPELLEKLRDASVLTVGENDSFLELGGMINLSKQENRIRPEINLESVERSQIKISSKLLSISTVVNGRARERVH